MKVYICEDEHLERTKIEETVRKVQSSLKESLINEIKVSADPDTLMKQIKGEFNIYLLDIDFGIAVTGIELGKSIRKIDRHAKIIYLTSHQEMALETITANVEPFSFIYKGDLLKPEQFESELLEMFSKIIESYKEWRAEQEDEDIIRISDQKQVRLIPSSKFLYLENYSRERKVKVQLTDEVFFINDYLGNLKKLFDPTLFYTEAQSMIINLANVEELNPQELYIRFKSGALIFVTKSFMKKIRKRMSVFLVGS